MLTVPLRKQGGATVVTLPSALLKGVQLKAGDEVLITVKDGGLVLTPAERSRRKRFTQAELLEGLTPALARALREKTRAALEGGPVGREIA